MNDVIIFCAKYLFIFVIIGVVIAWIRVKKPARMQFLVATIFAGLFAYVISRIASHLYFDPRPFVADHVTPLTSHAADNGFPSDHALFTMTLTAVTYFFSKKIASVMLVMTILVGVARILAKVHSPLDIGAGWVLGIIGAVAGYYVMRWIFQKYNKKEAPINAGS